MSATMLVYKPVFHLGCFEKMANAFFRISLSSLRLAFSFCNFLNSSSLGFRCPFPGKLPAGSSVYFRLHVRNRFSCIPRLRAASVTFRPPSVISLTASSLNCLSYFLFLLFSCISHLLRLYYNLTFRCVRYFGGSPQCIKNEKNKRYCRTR